MGTVLKPPIDVWGRGEGEGSILRHALVSELQERWGQALVEAWEDLIHRAATPDLQLWRRRAGYAPSLAAVFDRDWRLATSHIDRDRLIEHALCLSLGQWAILLAVHGSPRPLRDRGDFSHDISWLPDLRRPQAVLDDLRGQGWTLLASMTFEEADRLASVVVTARVGVVLLSPEGKPVARCRP